MEQPAENPIGPLFGLPPLTTLPLFFIKRNNIVRNAEIHDLEEQSTPGHEAFRALLITRQVQNDRVFVRLEDEVQDRRDVLLGTRRWRVEQISAKRDEGHERLLDNTCQNLTLLAEPIHRTRVSTREEGSETGGVPKCADHLEHNNSTRADFANVAAREECLGPTK